MLVPARHTRAPVQEWESPKRPETKVIGPTDHLVDHFAKLLATAPQDGRAARDIASFQKFRPTLETFIKAGGASKKNGVPATYP